MGPSRAFLRLAFYSVLAAGLVLSAVGLLGGVHVVFDGTNHFRPHLIVCSLIALAMAWFFDRFRGVAAAALCLTVNGLALGVFLPEAAPQQDLPDRPTITLATYNVWGRNDDHDLVAHLLTSEGPDVVVLQEVRPKLLPVLDRLIETYPHQLHCGDMARCGLALLSKYPFEEAQWRAAGQGVPPLLWARLSLSDGQGGQPLTVVSTHFSLALPRYGQFQDKEFFIDFLNGIDGDVVALGDFNATPWSHVVSDLAARTDMRLVHRFLPTWPARGVPSQFPIDLMLVSEGLGNAGVWRAAASGSDHRPVFARITLPPSSAMAKGRGVTGPSTKIADRLSQQ